VERETPDSVTSHDTSSTVAAVAEMLQAESRSSAGADAAALEVRAVRVRPKALVELDL